MCEAKFSCFQDGVEITQEGNIRVKGKSDFRGLCVEQWHKQGQDQVTSSNARAIVFHPGTEIDLARILCNGGIGARRHNLQMSRCQS